MASFRSINDWQRTMKARRLALIKLSVKTTEKIAHKVEKDAKRLAPKKTGTLIAGIRARPTNTKGGKGWLVESVVPTNFPYNKWVNRQPPYVVSKFTKEKPQPFFKSGQFVVYGKSAITPGGKPIVWTGTPGYFDLAVRNNVSSFRNEAKKAMRKAMRMRV